MNQYIYFSSKGSKSSSNTANSDFSVNFSNPIVIPPYAEIRCVNCRVNPNNNTFAVKEGLNDRLAFAVGKFWIPEEHNPNGIDENDSNLFPLFSIVLDEGVYDLQQGTDPSFYLNAQIESKINEQITSIPNLRNGVSVSVDANKILTIKVSPMGANGYYGIPDGTDLPDALLSKFKQINSRTTQISAKIYARTQAQLDIYEQNKNVVELAPFLMNASAPSAQMIPENQLGDYDITTDTLTGVFQVNDIVTIVGQTIYAKVLAVNANAPTKIQLFSPSDLWKTSTNPCNVNIEKSGTAGINCRITQFTSSGSDHRGVNLYAEDVAVSANGGKIVNRCGYYMSPQINWNSLGDWETSDEREYKLASIMVIDTDNFVPDNVATDQYRFVYSCFFDSIKGMTTGMDSAAFGSGPFSGAVTTERFLDDQGYVYSYEPPSDDNQGDNLTYTDDEEDLSNYLFRVQYEQVNSEGNLVCYLKTKEGSQNEWSWTGKVNDVTGVIPDEIDLTDPSKIAIETYFAPFCDTSTQQLQIVIKVQPNAGDLWETKLSVRGIIPNFAGSQKLCSKKALASKTGKPANIRFSYCHNAQNSCNEALPHVHNFRQPGMLYWAGAYNPIDEANGFVDGQFRNADYITSQAKDLPTNLPVLIFGDDSIDGVDKQVISADNPNGGEVKQWDQYADALLLDTGANAGVILGLDEQGWQYVKANSNTNGIEFSGNVNLNARDFPQHYLDLPDLAVKNHTGVVDGTGRPNHFICPLDLNSGAGTNNLHTSQNETLLYNDLGNAMEERITNLRIRICDLEGTPSPNLQNYTLGCIEIRENPQMKQMKMQRALQRQEEEVLAYQSGVHPTQNNRFQ